MIDKYLNFNDEIKLLFERFYELHISAPINLTAIKGKEDFYIKHYLDSIYFFCNRWVKFDNLCDIGSGGGFPGMVVAMFYPESGVFLVESIRKKADFLSNAARDLGLRNVSVINDRIENLKGLSFDFFTARGVSSVLDILKKSWNVSRETSSWLFYKGEKLQDELLEAEAFMRKNFLEAEHVRIEEPFSRSYCFIYRK
ncbi:MAG: 16S rRNA (guanine(527)-N(7))-methyltransferase RsmG [Calditerrivibrio sp.]|nr:16S rRNA (guanine(527)-N(7))-methyltransferase RsmG [Calditerrivibrio sp.]